MVDNILEIRNITKTFPGVKALNQVSFNIKRNEIHCVVGENGAGKSTLMKILSGVYPYNSYSGEIIIDGKKRQFKNIKDSESVGIGIIYQELALVPEMTIYENIFLGHEFKKGLVIDWYETLKKTKEIMEKIRLSADINIKVKDLGIGKQQLVEIAKAMIKDVKLLILDEPTAALNESDSENLLNLLKELKKHNVTIILVSHKIREVLNIADSITILRDGMSVCTLDNTNEKIKEPVLIKNMVGREIDNVYPKRSITTKKEEIIFEVKDWNVFSRKLGRYILKNINFNIKKGEIVGFAGLIGSGRTELARSLFGNPDSFKIKGQIYLNGNLIHFPNPQKAITHGLAYVTEDRKGNGLILIQDVKQNITLVNLKALAYGGIINSNEEIKVADNYIKDLNIKTPSIEQKVVNLSGGNQQKVSLAKWLFVKPKILILDEPTRGIDVGAKYEIYTIMNKLVSEGMSIIMISSELPEILGMSDRIYILSSGTISGELSIEEATQEKIMHLATN